MTKPNRKLLLLILITMTTMTTSLAAAESWRSTLYPEDWEPGFQDDSGRFLHDFSYAGYHRGEKSLPRPESPIFDVTQAPFLADPDGEKDSTEAIQRAIDAAGEAGGGVVYLPPGTYRVSPPSGSDVALSIHHNHVILRGAGPDETFLFNTEVNMRDKSVVMLRPSPFGTWYPEEDALLSSPLSADLPGGATRVPVKDVSRFSPGDAVFVRVDATQRFIDELGMKGRWTEENMRNRSMVFLRRVTAVDPDEGILEIDVPTRYRLLKADHARVTQMEDDLLMESGLEDLAIGIREHPGAGWREDAFRNFGTGGYESHLAKAVHIQMAENCWVRNVKSYAPPGNREDVHLLSRGLTILEARNITVEDCDFRHPQYVGAGGNGYMFTLQGNDCLLRNNTALGGRHNYSISRMTGTGNVITGGASLDAPRESDFHMHFAVSNLIDQLKMDGDSFLAVYRGAGTVTHGVTTSQSVFWNLHGIRYNRRQKVLIRSHQFGDGYVIGTRGPASEVDSKNFTEGVGKGESLEPQSLYLDQLERRLDSLQSP